MRHGLDLSNLDGPLSAADVAGFVAAGITDAIVGVQDEGTARQQIGELRAGGISVECLYCGIAGMAFGMGGTAIRIAGEFGLRWVAADCEDYADQPKTVADRQAAYLATRAQLNAAGLSMVRYSTLSYWTNEMGALDVDDPWWLADYGQFDGSNPAPITSVVLNGKTIPIAIHQYASVPILCGRDRDRDYFITPPWEEADMTPIQTAMLQACYDALTGGTSNPKGLSDITSWNQGGNALLEGYVTLQGRVGVLEAAPPAATVTIHTHPLSGSTGGPA